MRNMIIIDVYVWYYKLNLYSPTSSLQEVGVALDDREIEINR